MNLSADPRLTLGLRTAPERRSFWAALRAMLFTQRAAILAAFALSLPSLRTGLVADDLWHRGMLQHDARIPMHGGPLELFTFASGAPEDHARALELGFLPWWTSPHLKMSFFRPVASLTHALDYALWPGSPAAMHLHSVLWYVLVVVLAGALYRRLLGGLSSHAAAIAMLFYAIDPTHGFPAGWVANRNALISAAFTFGALLLHDTGVKRATENEQPFRLYPWATAASLALGLGAGESAVAAVVYLGAYAVFLDPRPLAARARSLVPAGLVTFAWVAVYRLGHFGVVGSGIYRDPIASPLGYLRGLVTNYPLLLASELGLSPDGWPVLSFGGKVVLLALALLLLAWAASILRRAVFSSDAEVRRVSRFLVAAACFSVLPGAATFASGRLLMIPGFAIVGLLAMVCAGAIPGPASRSARAFARWSWLAHLLAAPLLFIAMLHGNAVVQAMVTPVAAQVPTDSTAAAKRLVLVTAVDTVLPTTFLPAAAERGGTPPTHLLVLAGNRRDVRVTRDDERTLRVHDQGGFHRTGTELIFSDARAPLRVGTQIPMSDVVVTVTHVTADGVPDEATFAFTKDLADGYIFRTWEGTSLTPFSLPEIGASVTLTGHG